VRAQVLKIADLTTGDALITLDIDDEAAQAICRWARQDRLTEEIVSKFVIAAITEFIAPLSKQR